MTLKEVKEMSDDGYLYMDVRIKNNFKQAKVCHKNNTYAEIEGYKIRWEVIHKNVNKRFVLSLK